MQAKIEFAPNWDQDGRNSERAKKGNVEDIVKAAAAFPNGFALRLARAVKVVAGVHRSPGALGRTDAQGTFTPDYWAAKRNPDGGIARGLVADHHKHVTIDVTPPGERWHINVHWQGGIWLAQRLVKRAGQHHFEQESPGRRWRT